MSTPPTTGASRYRLDRRHAVRVLGVRMVVAAGLVVVAALVLGIAGSSGAIRAVGVLLGVAAALVALSAVWVLARPPVVVRLAPDGYRVRRVPSCGVSAARWDEVAGARTGAGDLGRTLEIVLADARSTSVPLVLVAAQAQELMLDVRARLDAHHGYRRLPMPDDAPEDPGPAGSPPPSAT